MGELKIPHDLVAERSVLGSIILNKDNVYEAGGVIVETDFYSPRNASIFRAMVKLAGEGKVVDPITIADITGNSDDVSYLISASMDVPNSNSVVNYAEIVYKHSVARSMSKELESAVDDIRSGGDPFDRANSVEKFINSIGNINAGGPESMTLYELEANADAIAPVVIPGMMNTDYRTIVVAEEGSGKSLLLRTIAMAASQGYHPFSHQRIEPVRALVIDLENPTQAITQTAVPYMDMLRSRSEAFGTHDFDPERLRFFRRPAGIDIRTLAARSEIQREIAFHRPQLVCIGPIYKMYRRGANESYEDSADEAMAVLDELRTKYGFALIMEHHAAKGKAGERRELSPMGSQRWMAWPEVGISLYKDGRDPTTMHVRRYRGDRLQGVSWPDRIMRDKTWLVEGVWDGGL